MAKEEEDIRTRSQQANSLQMSRFMHNEYGDEIHTRDEATSLITQDLTETDTQELGSDCYDKFVLQQI